MLLLADNEDEAPLHIDEGVAVGVITGFGFTVMVSVAVVAHCPADGVKVYVVVAVLFNPGAQVPVMLLFDAVGKAAIVAPEQIAGTAVKVGVTFGLTVTVTVAVPVQPDAVPVTV